MVKNRVISPRPPTLAMSAVLAAGFLAVLGAGCVEAPMHDRDLVFAAAREVLQERYALVGESGQYEQLYATNGVELLGNSRSRKQVTVYLAPAFGGRAEPRVSVQQYVEAGETPFSGDPSSLRASQNPTFWLDGWEPLERLPVEEAELYRAILQRASGRKL